MVLAWSRILRLSSKGHPKHLSLLVSDSYVLTKPQIFEETIKKSIFIAHAFPSTEFPEAFKKFEGLKDPKATHNCWAYRSHNIERSSDDGEPSGTAGRPILSALESENILDCFVFVTRYYGGIKLGSGGLVRAYGGVARQALKSAPKQIYISETHFLIQIPPQHVGLLYQSIQIINSSPNSSVLTSSSTSKLNSHLSLQIVPIASSHDISNEPHETNVSFSISCPQWYSFHFPSKLSDLCRGLVQIHPLPLNHDS